jgi:hypothetical protein
MRHQRHWRKPPPRPFYHPETGRELTRAEQTAYWAKLQADRIAEARAKEAARRAALTPDERDAEDRQAAEREAHHAAWKAEEEARREARERERWAARNDPYSTRGT